MHTFFKIIALIFLMAFVNKATAQSYAKYTAKAKDTVISKNNKNRGKDITSFDALMKKAFHEYRVKKFDEATVTYTEAFEISPDSMKFRVLHLRAYCYYTNGNYDKAIDDCTTAIEKTKLPGNRERNELYALRSDAYNSRKGPGDAERACADYKEARKTAYIHANKPLECAEQRQ